PSDRRLNTWRSAMFHVKHRAALVPTRR
ncbi:hypothetical protein STRIP9103_04802, partial [Streptomyces ipomoeae 91-03]